MQGLPTASGPKKGETWQEYQDRTDQEVQDKQRKADLDHLGCTEGKSTNLEETDRPFEMLSENQVNTSSPQQPPETENADDKETFKETVQGARLPTNDIGRKDNSDNLY